MNKGEIKRGFINMNNIKQFHRGFFCMLNTKTSCSRTTGDRTKAARLCSLGEKPGTEIRINLAASIDERRRILS
jgi:hypothetical protein